jgi:hypothetical protein
VTRIHDLAVAVYEKEQCMFGCCGDIDGALLYQQEKLARIIEDDLVCCNIYELMEAQVDEKGVHSPEWTRLRKSHDYHPSCFYGAWSAALVRKGRKR